MHKKRVPIIILAGVLLAVAAGVVLYFSRQGGSTGDTAQPDGEQLARQYCGSCHIFPGPELLDKKTWKEGVLPNMGWRLGIRTPGEDPFATSNPEEVPRMKELKVFPEQPLIAAENWAKIVAYYTDNAPEQPLPQQAKAPIAGQLPLFEARPVYIGEKQTPNTTLIRYDPGKAQLYVGDGSNALYILRKDLSLASNWFMPTPPVEVDFPATDAPRLLCIGSVAPTEMRTGNLFSFEAERKARKPVMFDSLPRPVHFAAGDLNGDQQEDALISCFGNWTGKLAWYESFDQQKEHVLHYQPGARRALLSDMNKDGLPDIVAMFSQGREELVLFLNKGKGEFAEKSVIQFPPVYGVSDFELADFNKDGFPDILVTNGDNWDLSPIKKFYHGIRVLMNDGQNNFKESYFYPSYGATKAMARDFDQDGDLDIAAISFSDDLEKTEHGFLYFENIGGLNFTVSATPDAANGKWITMEVADIDQDGDEDIVIGNFLYKLTEMTKLVAKGVENFPHLVVLWNKKK